MPRSLWFKVLVVVVALWAPLSQADTGWQPLQETIRKSEKDPRWVHYRIRPTIKGWRTISSI